MEYHEVQRRERGAGVGTAAVREGKGRAVLQFKRERGVRRQTNTRSLAEQSCMSFLSLAASSHSLEFFVNEVVKGFNSIDERRCHPFFYHWNAKRFCASDPI